MCVEDGTGLHQDGFNGKAKQYCSKKSMILTQIMMRRVPQNIGERNQHRGCAYSIIVVIFIYLLSLHVTRESNVYRSQELLFWTHRCIMVAICKQCALIPVHVLVFECPATVMIFDDFRKLVPSFDLAVWYWHTNLWYGKLLDIWP